MSLWACDKCGALTSFNFGVCSQCGGQAHLYNPQLPIGQQTVITTTTSPEWQPIETAPRGCRWVLLWWPSITDCAVIGYCQSGKWKSPIGSFDGYTEGEDNMAGPTHWMPLPEGPPEQRNESHNG